VRLCALVSVNLKMLKRKCMFGDTEYIFSCYAVSHGGRSDISDHLETKKHRATTSSTKLTSFFVHSSVDVK
jgi:hypothetical protein